MKRIAMVAAALLACAGPAPAPPPAATPPVLPQGLVFGDVDDRGAILWARAAGASHVTFEWTPEGGTPRRADAPVDATRDDTARLDVRDLAPSTRHRVRAIARGGPGDGAIATGSFRTAPDPRTPAPMKLLFGGDVAGQNVCRDASQGFPIFAAIRAAGPDVFIGLGDMIYGDDVCLAVGRYGNAQLPGAFGKATDLEGYWAHWRYVREESALRGLLEEVPYVAVWDDHEVVNDAGPFQDQQSEPPYTKGVALLPIGRAAFLDWNPVSQPEGEATTLHRTLRHGRHVEIVVLDTRGHRDPNRRLDDPASPKTMLGPAQRAWLGDRLRASDATWKIVISSVPISIPTGAATARDGWTGLGHGSGFQEELRRFLHELADAGVRNLVFLTTDVHFAAAFRYRPFADHPDFVLHELVTGPLNAGLFPNPVYDRALGAERLFHFGASSPDAVTTWEEAKRWFNFGAVVVAEDGTLSLEVRGIDGETLFAERLVPR